MVSSQIGYGDFVMNVKAGVTNKLMIINWGDANAKSQIEMGSYGDKAAIAWGD